MRAVRLLAGDVVQLRGRPIGSWWPVRGKAGGQCCGQRQGQDSVGFKVGSGPRSGSGSGSQSAARSGSALKLHDGRCLLMPQPLAAVMDRVFVKGRRASTRTLRAMHLLVFLYCFFSQCVITFLTAATLSACSFCQQFSVTPAPNISGHAQPCCFASRGVCSRRGLIMRAEAAAATMCRCVWLLAWPLAASALSGGCASITTCQRALAPCECRCGVRWPHSPCFLQRE